MTQLPAGEFTISRTLDAPLETVWVVWTQAEHFERWFHAVPGSVALDTQPGGQWQATMRTPYGEQVLGGEYLDVVEQESLVWTMDAPGETVVMAARFTADGAKTHLIYGQNVPVGHSCDDTRAGAGIILDSLENHLAGVSSHAR